MTTSNPSARLAEALSELSKSAYQAFSEVESQARQEVARTAIEIREMKAERDKALKSLHTTQLESQALKQALSSCKAALSQAELNVSHQVDTIASQVDTIAQLRRELAQWKHQSRNWQDHFLRVEQERCAQSSKIDELVEEKLKYGGALFPSKGSSYVTSINAVPSPSTKSQPSPTQPPPYRTAAPVSPGDYHASTVVNTSANGRRSTKRPKQTPKVRQRGANDDGADDGSSSAHKRSRKPVVEIPHKSDALPRPGSSTIIRRVHAVINVKQESESEEEDLDAYNLNAQDEVPDAPVAASSSALRQSRRRTIIEDEESDYDSERSHSGSEPPVKARRLRNRSRINYEEEEPEESEEDELMLNPNDNNEEVFGPSRRVVPPPRPTKAVAPSPKKKRKYVGR